MQPSHASHVIHQAHRLLLIGQMHTSRVRLRLHQILVGDMLSSLHRLKIKQVFGSTNARLSSKSAERPTKPYLLVLEMQACLHAPGHGAYSGQRDAAL